MSFVLYHKTMLIADRQCILHSCNLTDKNYYQLLSSTTQRDEVNKLFKNAKKTIAFGAVGDGVDHFEDRKEVLKFCRILEGFITEYTLLTMAKKPTADIDTSKIFSYLKQYEINVIVMTTAGSFLFRDVGGANAFAEIHKRGTVAIGSRAISLLTGLSLGKKLTEAVGVSAYVDPLSSADFGEDSYQGYDSIKLEDLKPFEIKM